MKTKLSFEELDTAAADSHTEEADAAVQVLSEELPIEDSTSEVKALDAEVRNLTDVSATADSLNSISQALEGYSPDHVRKASTRALNSAVQGLLATTLTDASKPTLMALEGHLGYTTVADQRRVSLENLESIKATFKAIWKKILEILARIAAWFKKIFSRQTLRTRNLQTRAQKVEEAVKAGPQVPPTKPVEPIVDNKINRRLTVKNHQITPSDLLHSVRQHTSVMLHMYQQFAVLERNGLMAISDALQHMGRNQEAFEASLEHAYKLAMDSDAGHERVAGEKPFKAASVFETELIFGGQSYFREMSVDRESGVIPMAAMRAYLARSSDIPVLNTFEDKGVAPLNSSQIDQVHSILKGYLQTRSHGDNASGIFASKLDAIRQKLQNISDSAMEQEGANKNLRLVRQVVNSYISILSASRGTLRSYDDLTLDAIMTYTEKSLARVYA